MKYKVTLEITGKYEMEIDAYDLAKASAKAEEIFANKANYNDISNLIGETVCVERIKS